MVKARNMFLCSSCNKYDANKTKKQRFYAVVFLLPLFYYAYTSKEVSLTCKTDHLRKVCKFVLITESKRDVQ